MMKVRGDAGKGQQKTAGLFPAPPFDRQQHRGAPGTPKAQAFFDYKPFRLLRGMEFPQQSAHAQKSRAIK